MLVITSFADFTKRPNKNVKESVNEKKFSMIMEEIESESKNEVQRENNTSGNINTVTLGC